MTALDLSAAVEAAGRARFEAQFPHHSWDDVPPINRRAWAEVALPLVTAAAPLIEAAVREQIAAEIEARLKDANSTGEHFALRVAASIARGGTR